MATKLKDRDPSVVDKVLNTSRLSRIGTSHATEVMLSVAADFSFNRLKYSEVK